MHKINEIRIYLCLQPIKSDQLKVLLIHPTSFGFFLQIYFFVYIAIFFAKPQNQSIHSCHRNHNAFSVIFIYFFCKSSLAIIQFRRMVSSTHQSISEHQVRIAGEKEKFEGLRCFYCWILRSNLHIKAKIKSIQQQQKQQFYDSHWYLWCLRYKMCLGQSDTLLSSR